MDPIALGVRSPQIASRSERLPHLMTLADLIKKRRQEEELKAAMQGYDENDPEGYISRVSQVDPMQGFKVRKSISEIEADRAQIKADQALEKQRDEEAKLKKQELRTTLKAEMYGHASAAWDEDSYQDVIRAAEAAAAQTEDPDDDLDVQRIKRTMPTYSPKNARRLREALMESKDAVSALESERSARAREAGDAEQRAETRTNNRANIGMRGAELAETKTQHRETLARRDRALTNAEKREERLSEMPPWKREWVKRQTAAASLRMVKKIQEDPDADTSAEEREINAKYSTALLLPDTPGAVGEASKKAANPWVLDPASALPRKR